MLNWITSKFKTKPVVIEEWNIQSETEIDNILARLTVKSDRPLKISDRPTITGPSRLRFTLTDIDPQAYRCQIKIIN